MAHPIFCFKRTYLALRKRMDEALQRFGLTAAQFDVLQYLFQEDGLEHRVLQERLMIASPTLTAIIDGMIDHGLIERRVSESDARVKQLFLTSKTWELQAQLHALGVQFEASIFRGFSPTEAALFLDWMDRVAKNIEQQPLPPP